MSIEGGLVAYNVTDVPNGGDMTFLYRISDVNGDPGANFTHDGLITSKASMAIHTDGDFLFIQNYNNTDPTFNSLISIRVTSFLNRAGK